MAESFVVIPDADSMNPLYNISLKTSSSGGQLEEPTNTQQTQEYVKSDLNDHQRKVQHSMSADSVTSQVSSSFEASIPGGDCKEKIIICVDNSKEMEKCTLQSRTGDKLSPLKLIKRALRIFLHSKYRINPKHEYALVWLKESAYWISEFTSDIVKIITLIDSCTETFSSATCELSSLFDAITKHAPLPEVHSSEAETPPYVIRLLLFYGRSSCIPQICPNESYKRLQSSPYFFMDAFYIHEPASKENKCKEIFDGLCRLDVKGTSYIFEATRNPTKFYNLMAQLIAHPLQRPQETDLQNNIEESPHKAGTF